MRIFITFCTLGVMLLVVSCGEEASELKQAISNMESIAESAKDMESEMNVLEKRREERRKRGDTLAMKAEELMKYLPENIKDYTSGKPSYESTDMPGMSFTQVRRQYTSANGKTVSISLTDYNSSEMGWMGASAIFQIKFKTENDQEMQQTFETKNQFVNGHERYDKTNKNVTVSYGIGGRFFLTIDAEDQSSTDWAKGIASSMNLDKLSKL